MSDSKAFGVSSILKLGEERMTALLTQLMSNEQFVTALQAAIQGGLKAKGNMDKGVVKVLGAFNVPTTEDVTLLKGKIEELEQTIGEMASTIAALEDKLGGGEDKPARGKRRKSGDAHAD